MRDLAAIRSNVNLTLPRSGIVLTIATLSDGRTVMIGKAGRAS